MLWTAKSLSSLVNSGLPGTLQYDDMINAKSVQYWYIDIIMHFVETQGTLLTAKSISSVVNSCLPGKLQYDDLASILI